MRLRGGARRETLRTCARSSAPSPRSRPRSAQAIEEAGLALENVSRTRVMLTDISRWKEAARAHGEVFAAVRPASTFVEVKGLIDPGWLVELEADCIAEG